VLPFEEVGAEAQDKHLGAVVGDLVVTNLARDHHLPLVERAALAKILDEQALGQSGAVADGRPPRSARSPARGRSFIAR